MEILGTWIGEEEDDLFVWMRRFESEAERERLYEAVYQSDHWKEKIDPKVPDMLDRERTVITRLEPAGASVHA